jgi:hypothetical protein
MSSNGMIGQLSVLSTQFYWKEKLVDYMQVTVSIGLEIKKSTRNFIQESNKYLNHLALNTSLELLSTQKFSVAHQTVCLWDPVTVMSW